MKRKIIYPLFGLVLSSVAYASVEDPVSVAPPKKTAGLSYFVDASFIYWYAKEDGMNIAESAIMGSAGQTFLAPEGKVLQQSFSYDPGFKVGGGIRGDGWGLCTEYTWLRSKNTTSKNAPSNDSSISGIGVWNMDDWFLQTTALGKSPTGTHVSSKCHLSFDIVDLLASNPIYEKKHAKVSALLGLRTSWIRQKMNVYLTQAVASVGASFLPPQPVSSLNRSHSWGIGPKMGLDAQYFLGKGFSLEGLVATSLLYARFSSIKHYEQAISTLALNPAGVTTRLGNFSSVRPVLEMGLGMGWCTNFFNKYGFELHASYDFSLFWGQNVIRKMLDEFWAGTNASAADLYLQGLTLEACFKF